MNAKAHKAYLLGQFRLERLTLQDWQAVVHPLWQHRHVRILLAYLLSSPGRRRGREQIMEELWPDLAIENAANRLNSTVHQLRQLLEPELTRPARSYLLRLEPDMLVLADANFIWTDIDTFEQLSTQAQSATSPFEAEQLLEAALTLYQGDFLQEERFAEWALAQREVLHRRWVGLRLALAERYMSKGSFTSAIEALNPLLAADPANEAAVQSLMPSLHQLDRRSEALHVYQHLVAALQEKHNIAPLHETRALSEVIRKGELPGGSTPVPISIAPHKETAMSQLHIAQTFFATSQREIHAPLQIGRSHQSPLIGRTDELATMRQILYSIEDLTTMPAGAHLLLLQGEAGIGKTRLAEELSREAHQRGWSVLWSRAYEQERDIPYHLWTGILRKAMANLSEKQLLITSPKARASITFDRDNVAHLSVLLPELQQMLPADRTAPSLFTEQEQMHIWEAALKFLTTISYNSPLLIVLDDLHWFDDSSLELLAHFARHLAGQAPQRILLVGTCRDAELASTALLLALLADLPREQAATTLSIQPLSSMHIEALVAPLPQAIVQHIQAQAAGNPFFAEELARYSSATMAGNAENLQPQAAPRAPLPDTITTALNRRMSSLHSACQRLLGKAVVLGGAFEFDLLGLMEPDLDGQVLYSLLNEAVQAGVLTEEHLGGRLVYHFWHPLIVNHLYEQLSLARRTQLHRKAAQALQQQFQGRVTEGAAAITHHLLRGGEDGQQIAHYAELAGNRAYTLSAYPEAQHYYELALAQHETNIPQQATTRSTKAPPSINVPPLHLALLLERLGECMMIQGNYAEAYHLFERVLAIRRQQTLATAAEQRREAELQALIWYEMSHISGQMSNFQGVQYCNSQGEEVLRQAGVSTSVAWACLRLQSSITYYDAGNYDEARQAALQAVQMFEQASQPRQVATSAADASLSTRTIRTLEGDQSELGNTYETLGIVAGTIGQIPEALIYLHKALSIFEQQNNIRSMANVCNNLGTSLLLKSEHASAKTYYRRSLSLAERIGDFPLVSTVCINLGELAALVGKLPDAEAWYRRCLTIAERINVRTDICYVNCVLATNLQEQGKYREAIEAVHRALLLGHELKSPPIIGTALTALACLRLVMVEGALATLGKGIEDPIISSRLRRIQATLHRTLTLPGLRAEDRARANLAQANLYLLQGDEQAAQALASRTLEVAQRQQNIQPVIQALRMLGFAHLLSGQRAQAEKYFQQAIQTSHTYNMRMEYGRALYGLGTLLLQHSQPEETSYQHGISRLREAKETFIACQAVVDLAKVERFLAAHPEHPAV